MSILRNLLLVLIAIGASLDAGGAVAQDTGSESVQAKLERWESEAESVKRALEFNELDLEELGQLRATLDAQLAEMPEARRSVETALEPLKQQRAALGEPPEDPSTEAPQISLERKRLDGEIAQYEARLKQIDQARARASGLIERLVNLRREMFTARLMTRGPSLLDHGVLESAVASLGRKWGVIALETQSRLEHFDVTPLRVFGFALGLAALVTVVTMIVRLRNHLIGRLVRQVHEDTPRSRRMAAGVGIALTRLVLPTVSLSLVFGAIWSSGLLGGQGELLLVGLARGTAIAIAAYALGGAFFAPRTPLLRLAGLDETDAFCAHRWMIVLAAIVGLDRALVQGGQDMHLAVEGLALLNTVLLVIGGLVLWKFMRHFRPPKVEAHPAPEAITAQEDEEEDKGPARGSFTRSSVFALRLIGWTSALVAPLLALAGYFAAARFAFFPVLFSGAVIGACVMLYHLVRTAVENVVAADEEAESPRDRLRLIPVVVGVLLFCAALPVLALIWGADVADLALVWRRIIGGFRIGEVEIAPLDFVVFAVVLVVGIIITRRLKVVLRRNILPLTGLDTGGRDAVAAGAGYVGMILAALVAIAATGIDLSNLAIVAGALSVGIGFGLQNIVNNFVSGIILLVERPIKAGDWIELPSGMGYVKTINVRSTEVETFDRSSLFVPNSQLISESVINWTHSNLHGRVIVPIRVAHGVEPRKVERILMEIARAHPLMLRRPAPYILFRGFDTDALLFEVRGILRDVNWVLNVQSDINFEISRRFGAEGIPIPVSQTDIRLIDTDRLGSALGRGFRGETAVPGGATPAAPASPQARPSSPGDADGDSGDTDGGAGDGR